MKPVKMLKIIVTLAVAALLFFNAVSLNAEVVERIGAIVNDQVILFSEVKEAAESYKSILIGQNDPEAKNKKEQEIMLKALDTLIEDQLLEQEITDLDLDVSENELNEAIGRIMETNKIPDLDTLKSALARNGILWDEYVDQVTKQLRKWKFVKIKFSSRIKISDDEVKEEYEKEVAMGEREYEYRARHILFKAAKDDPNEKKAIQRAKAEGMLERPP